MENLSQWAFEEFGAAALRDSRRGARARSIAVALAKRPAGQVSAVFRRDADREGAYDFLENRHVKVDALASSMFAATARRAAGQRVVHVAVDSSALSLTDRARKRFGPIGSTASARGLMSMNAYAVRLDGVPLGLVDQRMWKRSKTPQLTPRERTKRDQRRAFATKESAYFLRAAKSSAKRLAKESTKAWFAIDRGGDSRDILLGLNALDCLFTVRASWDRELFGVSHGSMRAAVNAKPILGEYTLHLPRTPKRAERTAVIALSAAEVVLNFRPRPLQSRQQLCLWVVKVSERSRHRNRVEWLLYTNHPVTTFEQGEAVLASYRARWRVEEFHRTWKAGGCNVEDTKLGSVDAVMKWATMHAAVAARIERIKYRARNEPEKAATLEFSDAELEALRLDQEDQGKTSGPAEPTMAQATEWLALLGGWIRHNGSPGAKVLARGLERLGFLVEGIALARRKKGRGGT